VNNMTDQHTPIGRGDMVDYDSATGRFSHWKALPERRRLDRNDSVAGNQVVGIVIGNTGVLRTKRLSDPTPSHSSSLGRQAFDAWVSVIAAVPRWRFGLVKTS
jgi:hypothetical protein